jgi:molybdopterin converting factor small subunit
MKVTVYAILKDYFDSSFDVKEKFASVEDLKRKLEEIKPQAAPVLNACRFAVNDEFVNLDFKIKEDDNISILPPASGG